MPGRSDATSTVEVQMGVVAAFGARRATRVIPRTEVVVAREPEPPPEPPVVPPVTPPVAPPPEVPPPPVSDGDLDDDSIEDARDKCVDAAETKNGIDDADGCPDTVPAEVTQALAAKLTWDARSAKITK